MAWGHHRGMKWRCPEGRGKKAPLTPTAHRRGQGPAGLLSQPAVSRKGGGYFTPVRSAPRESANDRVGEKRSHPCGRSVVAADATDKHLALPPPPTPAYHPP